MKILRIVLITVVISVLFISSSAQAQGGKIGYVALLQQIAPELPIYTQARQAFDQLAPQLLAAQQRGDILNFQPDFNAGVVIVTYVPGVNLQASLHGLTLHDNVQAAVASIVGQLAPPLTISAAEPQFSLNLGSSCVNMSSLGANTHVVGNLIDTNGRLVAALEGDANGAGNLSTCFNSLGSYNMVLPGYRAVFNLYIAGNPTSYSALAPVIRVKSFTKSTSVLNVEAPVGVAFSATWTHPDLNAANTAPAVTQTGTVSDTWSIDFGTVPFRGGDDFSITLTTTTNFSFTRLFTIPYFYCSLGGNSCGVYGIPAQETTLTITHTGGPSSFTGKFDYSGWFGGSLFDASGLPIFLKAGDTISSTGITTYSLPNLTAAINFSTDMINGVAPASKYFWVLVYKIANSSQYGVWSHSGSGGGYSSDFSSQLDMVATSAYAVKVYYVDPATGNETYIYITYAPSSCYALTRTHTGNGTDPAALPLKSAGCSTNYTYTAGEIISLTASPDSGWGIGKWTGTTNAANTGTTDTLVMPFNNTTVAVKYNTSTAYISASAQDGFTLESSETGNVGGTINSAATSIYLGDDAARKQYRSILSFNTSSLPDTASITAMTLKFKKVAIVGGGDPVTTFQGFMVDIKKGMFGTAVLEAGDFQATASKSSGPFTTTPVSNWYNINLTPAKAYVNLLSTNSGLTQIRLRFKLDDDNNAVANYLNIASGNAAAASRPQLVITYYIP